MRTSFVFILLLLSLSLFPMLKAAETGLWREGINLIPSPQELSLGGADFVFDGVVSIELDEPAPQADRFAARELAERLEQEWGVKARLGDKAAEKKIVLTRQGALKKLGDQGYQFVADGSVITIRAGGGQGIFYGAQTLLQIVRKDRRGVFINGLTIADWPDIPIRAVHYDTKHHQDRREYVESFIRDLAGYKINMLIWEWEDKFAYRSHPEIGAPGAFTKEEIQEITRFASQYHVQIVPLVQGLGHVSYVLKWPQNAHLREVPASNWEFCPQKQGSYDILFDLWKEAIEATPGSEYLHIGSDETFEIGRGVECGCKARMEELGSQNFYMEFVNRCAEFIVSRGRKFIAWTPAYDPQAKIKPLKQGPLMSERLNLDIARRGVSDGYTHWVYTPNPGLEQPFLPYFYRENERHPGTTLQDAYQTLTTASRSGLYEGMIVASWDDSGLHNQVWMMRFVNAAEYGWSGSGPTLDEFNEKYFTNYYGPRARDMRELFELLNRGAYYFMDSFERKVWHWGPVGKTHLPDLPRGDALEYDPFWNTEYADMVKRSRRELGNMDRARIICRQNIDAGVRHAYDLEVFSSIAGLVAHNARTYLALSELENTITRAHKQRFVSHQAAHAALLEAVAVIERNLESRKRSFGQLVTVWEKSRLPKGMSTAAKAYFHRQDRARHFANRRADMTYLICDEQLLGLEGYLDNLRRYAAWYKETFIR